MIGRGAEAKLFEEHLLGTTTRTFSGSLSAVPKLLGMDYHKRDLKLDTWAWHRVYLI